MENQTVQNSVVSPQTAQQQHVKFSQGEKMNFEEAIVKGTVQSIAAHSKQKALTARIKSKIALRTAIQQLKEAADGSFAVKLAVELELVKSDDTLQKFYSSPEWIAESYLITAKRIKEEAAEAKSDAETKAKVEAEAKDKARAEAVAKVEARVKALEERRDAALNKPRLLKTETKGVTSRSQTQKNTKVVKETINPETKEKIDTLVSRKESIRGLSRIDLDSYKGIEKEYLENAISLKRDQIFKALEDANKKVTKANPNDNRSFVKAKVEYPGAGSEAKAKKKAKAKAAEVKAKAEGALIKAANLKKKIKNGLIIVHQVADFFAGAEVSKAMVEWLNSFSSADVSKQSKNQQQKAEKPKFKAVSVVKEAKTKRLKWSRIVEEAQRFVRAWNFNFLNLNKLVTLFYLQQRCKDAGIVTSIPSFIEDSGNFAASLLSMIQELETDNLIGLKSLVEAALTEQGESEEDASTKANDLLYYLLHDGVLLNRDLSPVREMRSGSSAGGNQTQQPQKQPQQQSKENMKAEKLKKINDLWNEVKNSKTKVKKDQREALNKIAPNEHVKDNIGKDDFLALLERMIKDMSLTKNIDNVENLKELLKNKNAFLTQKSEIKKARQKGYALVPQVEFKRNDSASTLTAGYDAEDATNANGYTLVFKVTGEYNSAGNMLAELAGVQTELGDVIKVVAPDNANTDDKKFMVSAMLKAGYHPIVDGTYLLAGSEVHTYFTSLVSCVFSESDAQTSSVGALSYARSFISASALKKFSCPVVIANDKDGFIKGNKILEGNDGAMTHNGLGSKLAFQMRGLLLSSSSLGLKSKLESFKSWNSNDPGKLTLVKGLSTYCKVGFVKTTKQFVLLEDFQFHKNNTCGELGFKFDEDQVWEQELVKDDVATTITVGLFINASVVKGAGKKDSVKFGEVYSFQDFLGWIIAEDNPLIALTKWSWQHILNMSPWKLADGDRIFGLIKKQFEDYFSKKIKTEFDLLAGLNPKNVEFLNKNGPFKSQTVYVQMSNVGENVAFAKFDLYKHQSGMKKAEENSFVKQFGTVRTPIQSAGDYHIGNCYNITKVLDLFSKIRIELKKCLVSDRAKAIGSEQRIELSSFIKSLTDAQKTFLEEFTGTQESFSDSLIDHVDTDKLQKDFDDSWFALKGFIAPAVANGCLWLDADDQKKVNGDNDGDRNEIIFDTELLELLKLQHYKIVEANGSLSAMPKRETEVDKKEVANFQIGDGGFALDQIKTGNVDSNLKGYFNFICASGNSPNQGNVGGISMAPAALEAHVKYYRNDGIYTVSGSKLKAKANLFSNGQTLIDWQKRLLHLPSLLQWHLLNDTCKEVHADESFVICGQTKLDAFGSVSVGSKSQLERIELLKQKSTKDGWVEKLPSMTMADTMVEITDYDQGYSTPGIYLYTSWLVNAMTIAEVLAPDTGDGSAYDSKLVDIWTDWLVNDFQRIPEAITRPIDTEGSTREQIKDIKIKNIEAKLVSLYGDQLKGFVWVFSNELTSWMEDSTLGGSTKCPPQFDSLRKTGKIAFHSFVKKNFTKWYHDDSRHEDGGVVMTSKLADKVLNDNALELNSLLDFHKTMVPSVTEDATWDAFILHLMRGFKGALKEKLASTSTSMKYTTDLTQSGADSLSLLYKAIGNVDADDETEIGKLMFALKSVLVNSSMEVIKRKVTLNWLKLNLRNVFAHDIKEIYGMQKQKDLLDEAKNKLELLAEKTTFLKDNFLDAIEESLENAERHNLAMQHVNDAMLNLVKTDLRAVKDLSGFADFKKAIIAAETKAQEDLKAVLFKQSLEGKTIEIPTTIVDDAEKKSFVEKEETKIWLRSYENRTLAASLGVFRNAYRAVEFYEDAGLEVNKMKKILADTLIEKIKDESGNKTVEMMRTAIKFEVPEDLEIEIVSNIVQSRENITWLTKQIVGVRNGNYADADYSLEDLFIFKNGYTYISGQMLALLEQLGVVKDLKAWLTFTKRLGGGMVYTRATNEILTAILDKAPGKTGFTDKAITDIKDLRAAIHGTNLSLTAQRLDDNNEAVDFGIFWSPDYLTVDRMAWYKANADQWSFKRELRKFLHQAYDIELYKPVEGQEVEMNKFWGPVQSIMARLGLDVIGGSAKNSARSKGIEAASFNVNNIFDSSSKPKALSIGKQAESQPMPEYVSEKLTCYFAKDGTAISFYDIAEKVVKDLGSNKKEIDLPVVLSFFGLRSRMVEWLKAGLNAEKGTLDYNLLKGAIARTNVYSVRQALGFLLEDRDQIGGLVQNSIKFNTKCDDANVVLGLLEISAGM
jgi:hypothetical protein